MKILKKGVGGSREKGGGGNEIHAPCACACNRPFALLTLIIKILCLQGLFPLKANNPTFHYNRGFKVGRYPVLLPA